MGQIGYKIVNSDWTGQGGFKFEVGKSYEKTEPPKVGTHGFHFCKELLDCFDHFKSIDNNKKYCLIEAYGKIDNCGTTEYATNKIKIIKELSWEEVKKQIFKEATKKARGDKE